MEGIVKIEIPLFPGGVCFFVAFFAKLKDFLNYIYRTYSLKGITGNFALPLVGCPNIWNKLNKIMSESQNFYSHSQSMILSSVSKWGNLIALMRQDFNIQQTHTEHASRGKAQRQQQRAHGIVGFPIWKLPVNLQMRTSARAPGWALPVTFSVTEFPVQFSRAWLLSVCSLRFVVLLHVARAVFVTSLVFFGFFFCR